MDLNNRNFRPNQQAGEQHNTPAPAVSHGQSEAASSKKRGKMGGFKSESGLKIAYVFLLFSVTIVIVGVILALVFFKNGSTEQKFVDDSKYQAIFLNNGQVYFGHIGELNKNYLRMSDIYYLRVNQQVQPDQQASQNDVSLVKLGCELHGPEDSMTVNRDQVTFWENLKDDGQVAKAVAEYIKSNPNGQNCEQQAQQQAPAASDKDKEPTTDSPSDTNTSNDNNNTPTPSTNTPPSGN